jgi:ribose/xylose/arabinose/galactoside ABC-type transport system permease subunit
MFGVLVVLFGITALLTPKTFLAAHNLTTDLRLISFMTLLSLGEAVVIIAGGIDLSIGSIVCFTAVATAYLTAGHGMGIVPAVIIVLLLDVVIGLLQGLAIARIGVQPFVITLGGMLFVRGVADMITRGQEIEFVSRFSGFRFLGEGDGLGLPMPFWFALAGVVATVFLMHRTIVGRFFYAIGANAEAARLSGVPVARVRVLTYVISAVLAGFTGLLYSGYLPAPSPTTATSWELDAIAAVVLGGCSLLGGRGSVIGVIPGAAVMVVTLNGVNHVINPLWQNVARGTVILTAVIADRLLEKK